MSKDSGERPARRPQAGAAFAAAMEDDPRTQAAWQLAQAKLRAFAEALQSPEIKNFDADYRRAVKELTDAMREGLRASGDELAAKGFTPPATIEDWEHLAYLVEIPFETVRSGNLTAREMYQFSGVAVPARRLQSSCLGCWSG